MDVIDLSVGEPDIGTPTFAIDAAKKAIDSGLTKYTAADGIPELRAAILRDAESRLGVFPEKTATIVGAGAKHVIFNALMASLNPGDEVIIPRPYWVSYPAIVTLLQGAPVIPGQQDSKTSKLTPQELSASLTPKTKWLILNSPSNPSGLAYTKDELAAFGEILKDYPHVMIMSDDIYKDLSFEEVPHIATVCPFLKDRLFIVDGPSKAFSMTGWRIGFGLGPSDLIAAMRRLQSQQTSNACSIAQYATLETFKHQKEWHPFIQNLFKERKDFMREKLSGIGLDSPNPAGAFYLYANCQAFLNKKTPEGRTLETDNDFAEALLQEANVCVVPGAAFGLSPFVRISYAAEQKTLAKAVKQISEFLNRL